MDEDREVTMEELEKCKRYALDVWSLTEPDAIDLYHALRIMRIGEGRPVPCFDDFLFSYRLVSQ